MSIQRQFVITPNPAMNWRCLALVYGLMSTIILSFGVVLFFMGYTLVLPFCGLDVIGLGLALYVSAKKGYVKEVVTLSEGKVCIETGYKEPETRLEFSSSWARVILNRENNWLPSRLTIKSDCSEVEIGHFLNESERIELAKELKKHFKDYV